MRTSYWCRADVVNWLSCHQRVPAVCVLFQPVQMHAESSGQQMESSLSVTCANIREALMLEVKGGNSKLQVT